MKIHTITTFLTATTLLTACFCFLASAADDKGPGDPLELRLQAIEKRLANIEELLRDGVPRGSASSVKAGEIRVTVLGEVKTPGVYALQTEAPLASLIALAHGYTDVAKQRKVTIDRIGAETLTLDAKGQQRTALKDGDIVTVPKSVF